jgi:hypothetical protein
MPDLRTALLNAWAKDEEETIKEKTMNKQPHRFKTTNNASRETFNFIKHNPNLTSQEVVEHLERRGFKKSSTTALCNQMVRGGLVAKDSRGGLRVLIDEYRPIKPFKNKKEKVVKTKEEVAGLAALAPQDKEVRTRTTLVLSRDWTAQGVVNKLSVMQARELYDLLKSIFGG